MYTKHQIKKYHRFQWFGRIRTQEFQNIKTHQLLVFRYEFCVISKRFTRKKNRCQKCGQINNNVTFDLKKGQ